jgi:NADH-quinone oxidoreductase subunit H
VALLAAAGMGFLLHRLYSKRRYRWKDLREKEGVVFYGVLACVGVLSIMAMLLPGFTPVGPIMASGLALLLQAGIFIVKSFIICFIVVWIRWTLPRLRYDQLMALGWKIMLPLGIANIVVTGIVVLLFP